MSGGFTKLVPEIIQSSIWNESPEVRCVWITMLATKDMNGYVRGDAKTLARLANVSLESAHEALERFQAPDPSSHTPDNDGRRIEAAPGGWLVLNHDLYRTGDRAEYMRNYMRGYRGKDQPVNSINSVNINSSLPSVSVSVSVPEGECEGKVPPPLRSQEPPAQADDDLPMPSASQVAEWTAKALAVFQKHGPIPPTSPEAQRVRAHCAELIAYGKPPDKFALLLDWCANSRNPYRPKDAASMTDPAKWTKWQQSIEDEIERNNNAKGRRAHAHA